jgi:hypothetical protein
MPRAYLGVAVSLLGIRTVWGWQVSDPRSQAHTTRLAEHVQRVVKVTQAQAKHG